jgi:hypothetical protein
MFGVTHGAYDNHAAGGLRAFEGSGGNGSGGFGAGSGVGGLGRQVPTAVRLRAAAAYLRAARLHAEARAVVEEQHLLEAAVVDATGIAAGTAAHDDVREATGLVALDSVLGNAAVLISAPRGGLWCGGPVRPWPDSAWPLDTANAC